MADYLIYWKNYRKDGGRYAFGVNNPLDDWRTNCQWLKAKFQPGDRFWFVTAGVHCDGSIPTAGYLVGTFVARDMPFNQDDDGNYPADMFRYTIRAEPDSCQQLDPIPVDDLIRALDSTLPATAHIGRTMQGPRGLPESVAEEFVRRIREQSERAERK